MHQNSDQGKGTTMGSRQADKRVRRASRYALALFATLASVGFCSASARAEGFEFPSFSAGLLNEDLSPSTEAAARPYEQKTTFVVGNVASRNGTVVPGGSVKDLSFDLPPGIVGTAAAFPTCSQEHMDELALCPFDSQIGVARVKVQFQGPPQEKTVPVYNVDPPPGVPAQFGFKVIASIAHINFHVRTGSDYGVTATLHNVQTTAPLYESEVTIWGVPADPSHDAERYEFPAGELPGDAEGKPVPYPGPNVPLLSNPTSCTGAGFTTMTGSSWQAPGEFISAAPSASAGMEGCDKIDFSPSVNAKPSTDLGDSPSGLDFHIHVPQNQDPYGKATAHLRDSMVALPPSLTVNPSSANGLTACTLQQIGFLGGGDEKQTLSYVPRATASFTVSRDAQSTAPIDANAPTSTVAAAIETLPGLAGNIELQGSPGSWTVAFTGALARSDVAQLTGTVTDNAAQDISVDAEGGTYNLEFAGASSEATFDATYGAGEIVTTASNFSRPVVAGEGVIGPGIAPGTTVLFGFGEFIYLSQPATEAETGAHLKTIALPFNVGAENIEHSLLAFPALAGNVFVTATGASATNHSYRVVFNGALAGTEPAPLGVTSGLTGPGAEVTVTPVPGATHQLTVATTTEAGPLQFTPDAANCPDGAQLGTVSISSPAVIDHPLEGSVYLAVPHENPFDSLLAIYITVNDPKSGVVVKLPSELEVDPKTGQLTARVEEAPQLPFEDLNLEFFKGDLAPLKTGIACGKYEVKTDMVPWTAPEGATVHPSGTFSIGKGAGGGACVASEAAAPNTPKFEAGTTDPKAGGYSPFSLKLTRADGTQQLTGIDTTLPKGLIARLAGTPYCSDAALAAAAAKTGKAEQASPSCPTASRVGSVTVGAGAGPTPFYAGGSAYLAGPYKGAPLSLAVVTPAVAGPFDLGTVVVRNALYVDPTTTQVHAVSDPFPSILQGIPLDIRSIALNLDKPSFTKNPTNCSPFAITGAAAALSGQSAPLNQRFQAGDCGNLGFKPKLSLSLHGQVKRTGNPALTAILKAPEGEANIAETTVVLPSSQFIDNAHINSPCTRVQFNVNACPPKSILGTAVAYTPLLDQPLEGPVYFRSNGGERDLPDLVADLGGQIHVTLVGFIDSVPVKGTEKSRVRTTFANVPDAPVSKFVLKLYGGKRGLIQNSKNLCRGVGPANVQMDGQNGRTNDFDLKLGTSCKKPKKHSHKKAKQHKRSGH